MNRRPLPQAFLGVIIVLIGLAALLGQLDLVDLSVGEIFSRWWPSIIILLGVAALLTVPRAWLGPSLIIAVGVVLQLSRLDVIEVAVWGLIWPVAIILVGLSLLTRVGDQSTDGDTVRSAVVWWGSEPRSTSQNFRGGSLSAIMGGIELDLRQADIVARAEISTFAFWGGVEITVPPTWRVTVTGLPLLGGWEDKTTAPADPDAPELVLRVTALMGGVEVRN